MSFYDLSAPHSVETRNPLTKLRNGFNSVVKSMQYAKVLRALSELTDAQLALIDVTRGDIPSYAHELIYGTTH